MEVTGCFAKSMRAMKFTGCHVKAQVAMEKQWL
jgi:hypothetical protein